MSLFSLSPCLDMVVIMNPKGEISFSNDVFHHYFPRPCRLFSHMLTQKSQHDFESILANLPRLEKWSGELFFTSREASSSREMSVYSLFIPTVHHTLTASGRTVSHSIFSLHRDITYQKQLEHQLSEQSSVSHLDGGRAGVRGDVWEDIWGNARKSSDACILEKEGQSVNSQMGGCDALEDQRGVSYYETRPFGAMASSIEHDLNNILTPYMLAISFFESRKMDETTQSVVDLIKRNTHKGAELIKRIVSVIKGNHDFCRIRLVACVQDFMCFMGASIPKSISLSFGYEVPNSTVVYGNAVMIHHVLMEWVMMVKRLLKDTGSILFRLYINPTYRTYYCLELSYASTDMEAGCCSGPVNAADSQTSSFSESTTLPLDIEWLSIRLMVESFGGFVKRRYVRNRPPVYYVYFPKSFKAGSQGVFERCVHRHA